MQKNLPPYLTVTDNISQDVDVHLKDLNPDKIAILVDENTSRYCWPLLKNLDHDLLIEIKSGEEEKTLRTCEYIWSKFTKAGFTRKSLLINLGGGVIGDMGGFAAATYKRGISFFNIPTTLLSQVDASLGGKLGIDFEGLKNHIGVFQEPNHVFVDAHFLSTLPQRELKSGFAEVIKHALIQSKDQWDRLLNLSFDSIDWNELIPQSIAIKGLVVAKDPREQGLRKTLNYGHTIGHAIETYFLHTENRLLHGEAIAWGMTLENKLALKMGMLTLDEDLRIENYIRKNFNLPDKTPSYEELKGYLSQDKKNDAQGVRFSLLEKEGVCTYDILVEENLLIEVLK